MGTSRGRLAGIPTTSPLTGIDIFDDIKSVTSTVKGETSRMNQILDWILDAIGRRRERRDEARPTQIM